MVLCSDGTVAAWGKNENGQLGNNSTTNSSIPVAATGLLAGKTAVAISAGDSHNVAMCSDGTLAAWGYNTRSQLGNHNSWDSSVPEAVAMTGALSGKNVGTISTGKFQNLVLCSDGTIATWGNFGGANLSEPESVGIDALVSGERLTQAISGPSAYHMLALAAMPLWAGVQLSGNALLVANADTTPTVEDGTDFGTTALLNGQTIRSFTLSNLGGTPLQLTGREFVQISGDAAADFTLTSKPSSPIAEGQSTSFTITFDPRFPGTRRATVTIASDSRENSRYTFAISGFGTLAELRPQTIAFSPPAKAYFDQGPIPLSATASSGLPVTLSLISGPATLEGNTLTLTSTGTVKLRASQPGGSNYSAAATETRSIIVTANPTTLTLLNLKQTYDGNPKRISTIGGVDPVITYSIGGVYGSNAPTNAGTYPVKVLDGSEPKIGTLVIAKAVLSVRPDDKNKFFGQPNPPLTYKIIGFKGTDTSAVLTNAPVLTTNATANSVGGIYPITASAATALNYTFDYQPGCLVVESFAGTYEALLVDDTQLPAAKLSITVPTTGKTFTAKLNTGTHTSAIPFTGSLIPGPKVETTRGTATTNILVNKVKIPYVINFTLPFSGDVLANATRDSTHLGSANDGSRLLIMATGKSINYAGAHTAMLEPATPAGAKVPVGAGWATASVSNTGVMTLTGKLGDGTDFTSAMSPDNRLNPVYRLFVQPYLTARTESYLAGAITFNAHPNPTSNASLVNRRYVEQSGLTWKKNNLATDASYRDGFGTANTVLILDPWLPPVAGNAAIFVRPITLGERLDIIGIGPFGVKHSATGSAINRFLPTQLYSFGTDLITAGLRPQDNITQWNTRAFNPKTGAFTGSFVLSDVVANNKTVRRPVTFSGVLRQPALSSDDLIGGGHYLLPPLTGTEKRTGEIMFTRP